MTKFNILLLTVFPFLCHYNNDNTNKVTDFNYQYGKLIVYCSTMSRYQYLISIQTDSGTIENYYPSNLPEIYKNITYNGLPIIFSATIKDSFEQIYKPGPNDAPIPSFKAKVIKIAKIKGIYLNANTNGDFGNCFPDSKTSTIGYIVVDSKSYKDLTVGCRSTNLPAIDFNQFSLIGILTNAQCSAAYDRKVFVDNENKKYIYAITINQKGTCKLLVKSMNWAIVPKLPIDYQVVFRTTKQLE